MQPPEPKRAYVRSGGDNGSELLLMLFPEDWVCITLSGADDTQERDGIEFKSTFIKLSELSMIVDEMEALDD